MDAAEENGRWPSRCCMGAAAAALCTLLLATGLASSSLSSTPRRTSHATYDGAPLLTKAANRQLSATYYPGMLTVSENGLLLSQGLTSRVIARAARRIKYDVRGRSEQRAHDMPDYGQTYPDRRRKNRGGWIYVSNSENRTAGMGGVGAFTFNKHGKLIKYKRILTGTTANCGGGSTPWGAYITCEEKPGGLIYQVDPTGIKKPKVITMGLETNGGQFESFAYYDKDLSAPQFFVTEDSSEGVIRRFIPDSPDWSRPWNMLTRNGTIDYLMVHPGNMSFTWTSDVEAARENTKVHFPNTEGIDRHRSKLYFVTKLFKSMFILDLVAGTYTNVTTKNGPFDAQPDQIVSILGRTNKEYRQDGWLYFTEDGGKNVGIFARNKFGQFYTILTSEDVSKTDETTGLAFSPDGSKMYFALQDAGLTYEVQRLDGLSFSAKNLNVKYHDAE